MVAHSKAVKASLALVFFCMPWAIAAQTDPVHTPVVTLPQGAVTTIPSPDRKWTVIFEFPEVNQPRRLWIQGKGSSERTLVREFSRSLDISWSPDSQHFFVNDASGSGETRPYIYDPATLRSTDLAEMIARASPKAADYLGADHSYLEVKQWINSHELLIKMMAYFSEPPPKRRGFSGRYRVDLGGSVQKVHEGYWR